MAVVLNENDIKSFMVDSENAVIMIQNKKYILDYSTMLDFLTNLAVVTTEMESFKSSQIDTSSYFFSEYH